jgi:hypothetical protein
MRIKTIMAAATLTALVFGSAAMAQEQTLDTRIGKLTFTHDFVNGYPTDETVQKLYDERDFQRAVQLYLWSSPLVSNGEVRRVLMEAEGAQYGDLIPLSKIPDLSRFLTANVTTPSLGPRGWGRQVLRVSTRETVWTQSVPGFFLSWREAVR